MSELVSAVIKEIKPQTIDTFRNIKPEKEMSVKELKDTVREIFDKAALEDRDIKDSIEQDQSEKNIDPSHKDCLTTSKERKELADRSKGEWDGEPGNSLFHPEKPEAREALKRYGQEGIEYRDGEPDFSKVSEATVKIDNMTSLCSDNFKQADEVCAKKWNEQGRDGRTDWTPRDVEAWRKENRYSWHERLDMKTMNLVQRDIHEECKHFGGRAECRRREALTGGGFDD